MRASSLADLQRNHLLSLLRPESQQRVRPLLTLVTSTSGSASLPQISQPPRCTSRFLASPLVSEPRKMASRWKWPPLATKDSLACRCCLGSEQEPMDSIAQIDGEALSMSAKDFSPHP